MKVSNMTGRSGKPVANQFIVTDENDFYKLESFQSYGSVIVRKEWFKPSMELTVFLDESYWTTGKYRNQFLGETKAETQAKIDSGEYILTDLNP